MQALWAQNALFLGPLIAARLKDRVPELRDALVMDDVDPEENEIRQHPTAVVMLYGLRPTGSNPMRKVTTMEQEWLVALVVKSARRDGDRRSAEAGPLIPKVIAALQGWEPVRGTSLALSWKPGPRPHYGKNTSFYLLLFSIQVVSSA